MKTKLASNTIMEMTKNLFSTFLRPTLICTVLFTLLVYSPANVFGQTYNAPYDIPRFQNYIGECKLQAPTSSTAATQSDLINGYTSSWFYVVDGDKVAFNQSGSLQRTELRNLTNWDLTQSDRSLHARINIVQQTCDQVTVLQIHDDANAGNGPNKPLLRIYKHQAKSPTNHLWAAYKTDNGGSNTAHIDLGLAPSGYFNCDIRLVGGNMIIDVDGVEKANVDVSYWTFPSYWKAGVYLQDNGEATAYFDELYEGTGGSSGNSAPTASITSPSNGASFNSGDNVTISATAADSDGAVTKVEFYQGATKLGEDTTAPYSYTWYSVSTGNYDLTAVATDDLGATGSSGVVSISVINSGPATETYVSSILTGTQNAGKGQKHGLATVIILDDNGDTVSNASVTGTFSGTFSETVTGTTNSSGVVDLVTSATAKKGVSVDLCVDNVTHGSLTYNSSLNVITCTGSSARLANESPAEVEITANQKMLIFPNPSQSYFVLNLNLEDDSEFSARVYGLDGRVLLTIQPQMLLKGGHEFPIDLDSSERGIYLLETSLNKERKISRLIKN